MAGKYGHVMTLPYAIMDHHLTTVMQTLKSPLCTQLSSWKSDCCETGKRSELFASGATPHRGDWRPDVPQPPLQFTILTSSVVVPQEGQRGGAREPGNQRVGMLQPD